jgi:ABC-type transporter lipoprotein component MlaA
MAGRRISDVETPDTTPAKDELLRSAGFRYHFDRMAYVNRRAKKIFSVEAVEDHSEEWLRQMIEQPNESGDWRFYFDEAPTPSVVSAFLAELG